MAKQIEGVYERILECAKKEFLEKGYTDASLRTIASEAETSTNSIYVRFKDKEGLFDAIVEPVAEEFMSRFVNVQETFHAFDSETQRREVGQYSDGEMLKMVDYIYEHFDEFRLLLDASHGTRFQNFVDRLVSVEEEYTWKWLETTGSKLEPEGELTREFYHMMVTAYFEGICEVVRHGMCVEDAKKYISMMGKYHHAGFLAMTRNARNEDFLSGQSTPAKKI
ncbi:MAG: TetR/AcrR family transcriptional regulator [Roseburia sp.]|nr:TetR/AcrR family transcriptional regulator [Roseburia sp.]